MTTTDVAVAQISMGPRPYPKRDCATMNASRMREQREHMGEFVRGTRLGVDVGQVRVGVAMSDPDGILATPVATLRRDLNAEVDAVPSDIFELARLVDAYQTVEVVVGLPVTLAGKEGPAAVQARAYAERLTRAIAPVPVRLADERMSTVAATRRLAERGVRGKRQRAVVDQAAAVEILQGWLDAQRRRA